MKKLLFLSNIFFALLVCALLAVGIGAFMHVDPVPIFAVNVIVTVVLNVAEYYIAKRYNKLFFSGKLNLTIYRQVWTGEVITHLQSIENADWVGAITKDYSRFVTPVGEEAEVINLADFPIDPDVLIDNTIYPIPEQDLPINPLVLSLNKYQTKVTPITDDEVYAASVDKMKLSSEAHARSVLGNKWLKGAWNIAPTSNSAATPVLATTGPDNGFGQKMLVYADLLRFRRSLDNVQTREAGQVTGTDVMVLSNTQWNDLCAPDQKYAEQFYNAKTGTPIELLGFKFYKGQQNPWYTAGGAKKSLGSTIVSTDSQASFYFHTQRVAKATGSTKAYLSPSGTNPATQRATMNVRHYHMITRIKNEGVGAIYSATV